MTRLRVDGADVEVADDRSSLLDVLRDQVGVRSAKDGCSPQGQCGCCTVWVDGSPRVACVTPVRRLDGREVTTLEGLPAALRDRWADALVATGGSQCGFCTPGIVMRLAALPEGTPDDQATRALLAHLCRCTGWQTIREAARLVLGGGPSTGDGPNGDDPSRDLARAGRRAGLEGGAAQEVGRSAVLGRAGFADDTSPPGSLVAVPDVSGGYAVAESVRAARALAGKVQGRSTGLPLVHPLDLPPGPHLLSLRTTYVEPAYLEPDASWCDPGGGPAAPCANGGAFGGKGRSAVAADARRLADDHGRPVRVLWSREDVVRRGPKRPPVAGGVDGDGSGVLRVAVPPEGPDPDDWSRVAAQVAAVAPGLALEPVALAGPPVSFDLRGSVWVEAAVLATAAPHSGGEEVGEPRFDVPVAIRAPGGGGAEACCRPDGSIEVRVEAGPVLDEVVLRSYCIGATHQALGWVRSEGIAVDDAGEVRDLTIRSFGVLEARAMPEVRVIVADRPDGPAVNGSDAVFAAVATAAWLADGLVGEWPTRRTEGTR